MKFSQEDLKKIGIGVIVAALSLYGYFSLLLGPVIEGKAVAEKAIKAAEPEIKKAKDQIAKTKKLEQTDASATEAKEILAAMKAKIPSGATVAWVPQRLGEFFKKQRLPKATFKPNSELPDPDITGYANTTWSIEIPKANFVPLAKAIKALENEEGFLQILSLDVSVIPNETLEQKASLTISTLANAKQ